EDDVRESMIFLMALQDIYEGNSRFSDDEIDEIDEQAPDLIPNCVADILLASRPELIFQAAN
ncbi:MAG: YecA family protein, partial [Tropicimonas sp.]